MAKCITNTRIYILHKYFGGPASFLRWCTSRKGNSAKGTWYCTKKPAHCKEENLHHKLRERVLKINVLMLNKHSQGQATSVRLALKAICREVWE